MSGLPAHSGHASSRPWSPWDAIADGTIVTLPEQADKTNMQEAPIVRLGTAADAETLAKFNIAMAYETEGIELPEAVVMAGVRAMLDNPQRGFYAIAESGGVSVGALMITTEWSDWRNGLFWWIQSVYIAPAHRRRGIYRDLYQYVKDRATESAHVCGFRLYVKQHNDTAKRTYRALGMAPTSYELYEELI